MNKIKWKIQKFKHNVKMFFLNQSIKRDKWLISFYAIILRLELHNIRKEIMKGDF